MADMDLKTAAGHANAIVDHVRNRYAREVKPLERLADVLTTALTAETTTATAVKLRGEAEADLKHLLGEIDLAGRAIIAAREAERAAKERAGKADSDAAEAQANAAARIKSIEGEIATRRASLEQGYAGKRVELEQQHATELKRLESEIAGKAAEKSAIQKEIDALLARWKK